MAKKATKKETVEEEVKKVETVDMEQKAEQPTNEIKEEVVTETTTDDELVNTETTNEGINESVPSNDLEKVEEALKEVPTNLEITEETLDNEPVSDELSEVNQIQKEFEDLKHELDNNIEQAETPEQKEDLIKQEIKKAEGLDFCGIQTYVSLLWQVLQFDRKLHSQCHASLLCVPDRQRQSCESIDEESSFG